MKNIKNMKKGTQDKIFIFFGVFLSFVSMALFSTIIEMEATSVLAASITQSL
jgi:hypothetical protein